MRESILQRARATASTTLQQHPLFQNLHRHGNISMIELADEQMKVLRHRHVADYREFIFAPDLVHPPFVNPPFASAFMPEGLAGSWDAKDGAPTVW